MLLVVQVWGSTVRAVSCCIVEYHCMSACYINSTADVQQSVTKAGVVAGRQMLPMLFAGVVLRPAKKLPSLQRYKADFCRLLYVAGVVLYLLVAFLHCCELAMCLCCFPFNTPTDAAKYYLYASASCRLCGSVWLRGHPLSTDCQCPWAPECAHGHVFCCGIPGVFGAGVWGWLHCCSWQPLLQLAAIAASHSDGAF